MAGPTCELLLESDDDATLNVIDGVLASTAERMVRTRKGRAWDIWISGRPVRVGVESAPPTVRLAAGCNQPEDDAVLRRLCAKLVSALGGLASEPIK